MSGICSHHRHFDPNCHLCKATPHNLFPDWDEKEAEAKAAGTHDCSCGFTYYRTVDRCPKCGRRRLEIVP